MRQLGVRPYQQIAQAMGEFTYNRDQQTLDELWLVQHHPVFTQGQAGKAGHILNAGDIPVIQSDRGGQVTYHGPGQQILYVLLDLKRYQLNIRQLVSLLEHCAIDTLKDIGIDAQSCASAPGVYVGNKKIASLGLRIRRGCSLHGLALNVAMDLAPFNRIHPCGYSGLIMTQVSDHCLCARPEVLALQLAEHFTRLLAASTNCLLEMHPIT